MLGAAALFAGMGAQQWLEFQPADPEPVLSEVPAPILRDLQGRLHRLGEWRGKVLVVNFWATWCLPCREEMPEFVNLQKELGGRGLQFVGIAIDEAEAVSDFLEEVPVNYPILLGDEQTPEWSKSLGNRMEALPFSVVFDRGGVPVYRHTGVFGRSKISEVVIPLLGSSEGGH